MAKDHSYSKRGIPLPPIHGLLFQLAAISLLYIYTITQSSIYKGLCYTSGAALPITNTFMLYIFYSLLCRCLYILCDWKMKVVFHSTVYTTFRYIFINLGDIWQDLLWPIHFCVLIEASVGVNYVLYVGRKEMVYLTTHSTHFIYGYMASDIWLRTILIVRKETRCRHIGYSLRLTTRVLLYAPSLRQDNTYYGLCYTSRGALAGTRNSSMGSPMKDRSDNPPHHERTLYLWATSRSRVLIEASICVNYILYVGSNKNKHDIFGTGLGSQGSFMFSQIRSSPPHTFLWFTSRIPTVVFTAVVYVDWNVLRISYSTKYCYGRMWY